MSQIPLRRVNHPHNNTLKFPSSSSHLEKNQKKEILSSTYKRTSFSIPNAYIAINNHNCYSLKRKKRFVINLFATIQAFIAIVASTWELAKYKQFHRCCVNVDACMINNLTNVLAMGNFCRHNLRK